MISNIIPSSREILTGGEKYSDHNQPYIKTVPPDRHIHIISFNIPYPPDYGGIIDIYYKIKALYDKGIKVHLHCFEYGREKSPELENICHKVNYYRRVRGFKYFFSRKPYIVATRFNTELYNNLQKDSYPILYEGLHTSIFTLKEELKNRIQIIRMHNIEFKYYNNLSNSSDNFANKIFFKLEALKLNHYEKTLDKNLSIACICEEDTKYYKKKYSDKFRLIRYVPPFHENNKIISLTGRGNYVLYHGNLSVCENEKVVLFILKEISGKINAPLIIAGKNPTNKIIEASTKSGNSTLVANPDSTEMENLQINAHIHLLPGAEVSGIKLKLINSLFKGRFCVVNDLMIKNTGLHELCYIARNNEEYIRIISYLLNRDFKIEERKKREIVLGDKYSNSISADKLLDLALYED